MKNFEEKKHKLLLFPRIIISLFILIIVLAVPLVFISSSECFDLALNALNFLKGKTTLDSRYSNQEQSHFSDVKIIFDFTKALVFVLFIFVVIYLALFFMLDKKEIFRTLKLAGWMIIIFLGLLLLLMMLSFQGIFFFFHELLFPQGNWTFPFDSTIITVFSESFFVHAAFTSVVLSLGVGLVILGMSYFLSKK